MASMPLLLLMTILLPLVGVVWMPADVARARRMALATALLVLATSLVLVFRYPPGASSFAVFDVAWLSAGPLAVHLGLGLDGLSLWLFALTPLLGVVAVLVSWEAIDRQPARYYRLLGLLESGMLGVFAARDLILFYVFFEFTLIPLVLIVGIWGSEERQRAAVKFFLYTLSGSVLTLLGLVAIVLWDYQTQGRATFSMAQLAADLAQKPLTPTAQLWIFLALFAGFAIKVPLFPLHTWLPLAHVQAPAAGSVILAGLLLKIGTYGFLRFSLPMLPTATVTCMPWILGLSVAGILYGGLVALAQRDIKRLVAYSSVSHLGFCMLGIFALNGPGVQGGTLQMINHGLATGGLFALVGMLYERYHTRQMDDLGGLARRLPVMAFFLMVLSLSSIGLPGLGGFVGEFLVLLGMFQRAWVAPLDALGVGLRVLSVLALLGVVLGAWYMLRLVERVLFGPVKEPPTDHGPVRDLCAREIWALAPLAALLLWIGIQPGFFLVRMTPTLDTLTAPAAAQLTLAMPRGASPAARR
jgi:NADH-quinone oxidoreductase subunit M